MQTLVSLLLSFGLALSSGTSGDPRLPDVDLGTRSIVDTPSKNDKRAFPEARCMWRTNYERTLLFARRMEFGIERKTAMEMMEQLSIPCARMRATPRGDIIAAIHLVRDQEVAGCIERANAKGFRRLGRKLRAKETSPAVVEFVQKGFPAYIAADAARCDPDLVAKYETEARRGWWNEVVGRGKN